MVSCAKQSTIKKKLSINSNIFFKGISVAANIGILAEILKNG
jgi:hypothetical protein